MWGGVAGPWFKSSVQGLESLGQKFGPSPIGSGEPILAFPILRIITLANITGIEITNSIQGNGHFHGS